jgi:hypothetical protein
MNSVKILMIARYVRISLVKKRHTMVRFAQIFEEFAGIKKIKASMA